MHIMMLQDLMSGIQISPGLAYRQYASNYMADNPAKRRRYTYSNTFSDSEDLEQCGEMVT